MFLMKSAYTIVYANDDDNIYRRIALIFLGKRGNVALIFSLSVSCFFNRTTT